LDAFCTYLVPPSGKIFVSSSGGWSIPDLFPAIPLANRKLSIDAAYVLYSCNVIYFLKKSYRSFLQTVGRLNCSFLRRIAVCIYRTAICLTPESFKELHTIPSRIPNLTNFDLLAWSQHILAHKSNVVALRDVLSERGTQLRLRSYWEEFSIEDRPGRVPTRPVDYPMSIAKWRDITWILDSSDT